MHSRRPFALLSRPACLAALALAALLALFAAPSARAQSEVIPPPPKAFFNDYAGIVGGQTAARLNRELENFEKTTSNQIVVAIFQRLQSDSSVDDYCVRTAQSWHVGQKGKDNGAVLFVFLQNHKVYISVGYGLEPVLPDALANRIIRQEITPRFRSGDFAGGITAGVEAMMAATRGEYKGTGRTHKQGSAAGLGLLGFILPMFVIFAVVGSLLSRLSRPRVYSRRGGGWGNGPWIWPGGGFGGGGGSGGGFGGFGGGGGGGFSGGGGSFGGGGAGGSW